MVELTILPMSLMGEGTNHQERPMEKILALLIGLTCVLADKALDRLIEWHRNRRQ